MTPSNKIERDESSSSGGSFVNDMNRLSTAMDTDSREASDMSTLEPPREGSAAEHSESDYSGSAKASPSAGIPASPSKKVESLPVENAVKGSLGSQAVSSAPKGQELVFDTSTTSPTATVLKGGAGSPSSVVVEPTSTQSLAVQAESPSSWNGNLESSSSGLPASGESAAAKDPVHARHQNGASSDNSVGQTVGSSSSANSSRSEPALLLPIPLFPPVEAQVPVGHVHLKEKKSTSDVGSQQASMSKNRRGDTSSSHVPATSRLAPIPGPSMMVPAAPVKGKSSSTLRRGKWTVEEEAYVARVIQDFNSGFLNAPAGTTLRTYLSEKLHCDPMRITKKFTGDACIGKRVFHPAVRCASNAAAIDKAQAELDALERRWRRRLEMQQRESAKKAAASAAAAVAAATGRSHMRGQIPHGSVGPTGIPQAQGTPPGSSSQQVKQTAVARTASWLDRANAVLSSNSGNQAAPLSTIPPVAPPGQLPPQEIENQMKEVQRLIHEGPIIQQTTAGLPHLLEHQGLNSHPSLIGQRKVTDDASNQPPEAPPVDKRPRTSLGQNESGAEDAEALVGFLNCVRASAEASESPNSAP